MAIYGQYGGPNCRHYDKLSYVYGRNRTHVEGESQVAMWVGAPTGPCGATVSDKSVCAAYSGRIGDLSEPGDIPSNWRRLSEQELLDLTLTSKTHSHKVREYQAELASKHGFKGPIKGGEARAISHFLRAIGKDECVRRLWIYKIVKRTRYPGTSWARDYETQTLHGPVYAFKPFLDGYSFEDFMRVFRMMRPGTKNARAAIREAMANPTMTEDLDMLKAFDSLGALGGSK